MLVVYRLEFQTFVVIVLSPTSNISLIRQYSTTCVIIEHTARAASYPPTANFVIVNTKNVGVTQVADMVY